MAKRSLADRKDGVYLKRLDSMHTIMPLMYPNRCDNEAFISERIDLTNVNAYLKRKNAGDPAYPYNLFQIITTPKNSPFSSILTTLTLYCLLSSPSTLLYTKETIPFSLTSSIKVLKSRYL